MEYNYIFIIVIIILITAVAVAFYYFNRGTLIKEYWDNGKKRRVFRINKENQKIGTEKFFYRNGKLNKKQSYVKNLLEGISIVYYPTGEKYVTINYLNGKKNGEFNVYARNGVIIKTILFRDDEFIEERKGVFDENSLMYKKNSIENSFSKKLLEENRLNRVKEIKDRYNLVKQEEETIDEENKASGILSGLKKVGKTISGIQAYQDRKSGIHIREACETYEKEIQEITEEIREDLNQIISLFGQERLKVLKKTTGIFLGLLKDMKQKNKTKEYELLDEVGINMESIKKMQEIDINVSKILKSTAAVGALGAVTAMGTPTLVTGAIMTYGAASTGTAISSLSGAAATNATLAWLGGGSLASGGGGMAAGTALLGTITTTATLGVGLLVTGLIASVHYSGKLKEIKEYQAQVEINVANTEVLWELLEGINKRTEELQRVTQSIVSKVEYQLELLKPLSVDYDVNNKYYNSVFQTTGLLIKAINELTQTPLLDEEGNPSSQSQQIIEKTKKVLNTTLVNYEC